MSQTYVWKSFGGSVWPLSAKYSLYFEMTRQPQQCENRDGEDGEAVSGNIGVMHFVHSPGEEELVLVMSIALEKHHLAVSPVGK